MYTIFPASKGWIPDCHTAVNDVIEKIAAVVAINEFSAQREKGFSLMRSENIATVSKACITIPMSKIMTFSHLLNVLL
jgi:hypothetical protein